MKKLKLPIITGCRLKAKHLSMDDYLKFVYLNLKYSFNKKAYRQEKQLSAVRTAFSLKTN